MRILLCYVYMLACFAVTDGHLWWGKHDEDCQVTAWGPWSTCSKLCGQGLTYRTRNITVMHQHHGQRCPSLEQTNLCFVKPCPVICRWGTWGEWSSCDKCGGGLRSRYRKVAFPSLYGGQRCEGSDAGIDYNCTITGNCSMLTQQCSKSQPLRCDSDSHCIASWLKCNGDADCEDTSDERNCTTARNPCGGVVYKSIPNIGNIGAGYDILKAESMGHVLDNNKYGGTCDTVYLGEFQKRFRKPYNIQSYRSSAEVHTTLRVSSYRNTMELNEKKNKDYEYKISAEISFAYDDIVTYGAKAAKSEENVWKKIIESRDGRCATREGKCKKEI